MMSQPERLSLGILKVASSVFAGPKKPAGRPVDLLNGACLAAFTGVRTTPRDLPLVLILGTGIFAAVGGHLTLFIRGCTLLFYSLLRSLEGH